MQQDIGSRYACRCHKITPEKSHEWGWSRAIVSLVNWGQFAPAIGVIEYLLNFSLNKTPAFERVFRGA